MEFVDEISSIQERFNYNCEGKYEQNGIIKTNCLNSLDRTDSFHAVIRMKIFIMLMKNSGVNMNLELNKNEAIYSFQS